MKNGYYLSVYSDISTIGYLWGISKRHDHNISLWEKTDDNVALIHYWELERITGYKQHECAFFSVEHITNFINTLLKPYGLDINMINDVWGMPELHKNDHYLRNETYDDYYYHEISHLFSSILLDTEKFNNEIIIGLAVDCAPDNALITNKEKFLFPGCIINKGEIEVFPVCSPAPLWDFASKYFKLKEGTLMALASANNCYVDIGEIEIPKILSYNEWDKIEKFFFGIINEIKNKDLIRADSKFTYEENKISAIMKIIQDVSIKIMDENIDQIIKKHKIDTSKAYLSLSGGYTLNCPTNSHLMDKYRFKGFLAPPCVNDSGLSLGMALYAFYKQMSKFKFKLDSAYYGNQDYSFEQTIDKFQLGNYIDSIEKFKNTQFVEDLKKEPVIWFDDRAEIGPRALGHRSILADPRYIQSKNELNRIKKRQWWRPVAPIILESEMSSWFDNCYVTPYMLHTFNIQSDKEGLIPAVAHLNLSARIQTLNETQNPKLYNAIKAFQKNTDIPIICNTSLNDKGEPIIDSIDQALNFALRKDINIIYINGKRIKLKNHNKYYNKTPAIRNSHFEIMTKEEKKERLMLINPHNISADILIDICLANIEKDFDITNINDVVAVTRYIKLLRRDRKKDRLYEYSIAGYCFEENV